MAPVTVCSKAKVGVDINTEKVSAAWIIVAAVGASLSEEAVAQKLLSSRLARLSHLVLRPVVDHTAIINLDNHITIIFSHRLYINHHPLSRPPQITPPPRL